MAARPEQRGQFRADQARSTDDNDLHFFAPAGPAATSRCITKTSCKAPL
jgi:hypothetical protein